MELGRYCQHFEVVLTIFDPFFEKVTFLLLFGLFFTPLEKTRFLARSNVLLFLGPKKRVKNGHFWPLF